MGPLPKRRHSTRRQGSRRSQHTIDEIQTKHRTPALHKRSLLAKLKKALGQVTAHV